MGPGTVTRDWFDYNTAIADSWKEQTLLNIIKIRYADMPLFVEVASVVSGYTPEGTVNLGGTLSSSTAVQGDFLSKRTFAFLMILFSLTETGGREGLPLLTIPAG